MHLELRHLRTIKAIHDAGGLARAAERLHITQSALSHQVKGLEEQVGLELFLRRTKPLKLSPAGLKLLRLAERVLPEIEATQQDFEGMKAGKSGRLHIALECHACYDWLLPVLDGFRKAWPEIDVDIRAGLSFDALPALAREEVDLVISADPEEIEGVTFAPLFDYEPVFVCAASHPLARKGFIEAADLAEETLITYPVDRSRLDVFTGLLAPGRVEPRAVRPVELTAVILMLVASDRGVTVLPDWVVRDARGNTDLAVRPLTETGLTRRMYAATRDEDAGKAFMAHFIRLARSEPVKFQRA